MRTVVLPQAFRSVVPPLMNDFVSLQKDVALVSLLGPVEIAPPRRASTRRRTSNFTPYVAAAVIFLALTDPADTASPTTCSPGSAGVRGATAIA